MKYISITIKNLQEICEECSNFGTEHCDKKNCNVGFALSQMEYIKEGNDMIQKDGLSLLPKEDTKYYDEVKVAHSIASICKLCKGCNENHSELCAISLARKSIEGTFLKEMLNYPGNPLVYFVNVSKQNSEFTNLIIQEFKALE